MFLDFYLLCALVVITKLCAFGVVHETLFTRKAVKAERQDVNLRVLVLSYVVMYREINLSSLEIFGTPIGNEK